MSYFATCLDDLLERKGLKAVDLAKASGVGKSMISRYRNDEIVISREDLAKICGAISEQPAERAELLRAHLLDECDGPGSELITIEVNGPRKTPPTHFSLGPELENHFQVIREWVVKDKNVREVVEGLGGVLSSGDVRTNNFQPSSTSAEDLEGQLVSHLKGDLGEKPEKPKPSRRKPQRSPSA